MKILCSGGKGEMDHDQCLACALMSGGAQKCGYDYALLKSMFGSSESDKRRNEIHVTDLTGCLRRAWYDKRSPSPAYVHETLALWLGTAIHGHAEGSDSVLDSELPVSLGALTGRSDVVYKDGRLVDLKSTRWLMPDRLPYGSHALQVNIYAYMLRKAGREINKLQIQYIDASGPTKCRKCKVPVRMINGEIKCPSCGQYINNAHLGALLVDIPLMPDLEIADLIGQKMDALTAAMEMDAPPEKEPGYLCAYCSHATTQCFPEEQ